MLLKILLSGDGGQGIQTIGDIICRAAFARGWQVSCIPNYGLEQRGGVSLSFIQISDNKISYPKFSKADILVVLSEQAKERTKNYQETKTRILNYKDHEAGSLGQSLNIFFLGLLTKNLQNEKILEPNEVYQLLEEKLKNKLKWEENKKAFEAGLDSFM